MPVTVATSYNLHILDHAILRVDHHQLRTNTSLRRTTATLYEDEDFRVILDASPASKGHALIIPKEHYANLYELDDDKAAKVMVLAKKMITKLTGILHCDGYNIVQNNNEAAGQTVFHFHLHMIPRYKGDEVGLGWKMGELTEEDKQDILSKL